jgi:WW domain-containing oxidoreductase
MGTVFYTVLGPIISKTIPQGAATQVYVATHPSLAEVSGKYFVDCNLAAPRSDAEDPAIAKRLWEVSEEIAARV